MLPFLLGKQLEPNIMGSFMLYLLKKLTLDMILILSDKSNKGSEAMLSKKSLFFINW